MIVAVEGMDGVGKTTICEFIEKRFGFINIEKPTKYMFEDKNGNIDYDKYYKTLNTIYKKDELARSEFFAKGNFIAVTKYPNSNVVLDRHLLSNFYWNANNKLYDFYDKLIELCGKPDLTIYLYATPETRYNRLKERNINDIDLNDPTVLVDDMTKNIEFLEYFGFNYRIIYTDNKTINEVCEEVDNIMTELINLDK